VLTRVKTGEKTKIKWMTDEALGCDANWCTLDLGALEPRVALKRGQYTWRVFARNLTFKMSVSKSNPAAFRIKPETRTLPLPAPEAVDGFRAP
jgi:hypothetical protein